MKNMKKHRKLLVIVLLLGVLTVGSTLAYAVINSDKVENQITVGNIQSEIYEPDMKIVGNIIEKKPQVENTGNSPMLVRVRLVISPEGMVKIGENITINEKWKKVGDYFYYQGVVLPDGKTEPIFEEVSGVIDEFGNFLDDKDSFEITVYQESIQTSAREGDGDPIDAYENFEFNETKAMQVWNIYDRLNDWL